MELLKINKTVVKTYLNCFSILSFYVEKLKNMIIYGSYITTSFLKNT